VTPRLFVVPGEALSEVVQSVLDASLEADKEVVILDAVTR